MFMYSNMCMYIYIYFSHSYRHFQPFIYPNHNILFLIKSIKPSCLPMSISPSFVSPCFPHENPMVSPWFWPAAAVPRSSPWTFSTQTPRPCRGASHDRAPRCSPRAARGRTRPCRCGAAWRGVNPKKRAAGRVKMLVHAIIFWWYLAVDQVKLLVNFGDGFSSKSGVLDMFHPKKCWGSGVHQMVAVRWSHQSCFVEWREMSTEPKRWKCHCFSGGKWRWNDSGISESPKMRIHQPRNQMSKHWEVEQQKKSLEREEDWKVTGGDMW